MLLLTKSAQCEASLIFHEAQQHVFAMQALNALSVLFCQGQATGDSTKAHAWHRKASAGFHASVAGKVVSTYFAQWIFGLATTVFQIRLCVTHPREDAIAETFHLLRGTARLAIAIAPRFMQDQRLAHDRTKDTGAKTDPEFLERIRLLKTSIRMVEPNGEYLIQAAESLQTWCASIQGQPRTWLHILSWPALVSEDFVTKLHCKNQNRSVALAIFLHWCVIMIRFDDTWFLDGWITQLAQQAWAQLGGGWESTVIPAVRALRNAFHVIVAVSVSGSVFQNLAPTYQATASPYARKDEINQPATGTIGSFYKRLNTAHKVLVVEQVTEAIRDSFYYLINITSVGFITSLFLSDTKVPKLLVIGLGVEVLAEIDYISDEPLTHI
ncbi:hypothetical protein CFAM422_003141 [Trichoderma lentiforme]|uniref:Uncharacterized protein n=1 Tax=Trichoderma lentiforme TaxID=1567552 RepID=A0A9P4XNL0_9HYPO|nr:hypothetical protein CFAM422_003141 [Trichoderma lentiforme]